MHRRSLDAADIKRPLVSLATEPTPDGVWLRFERIRKAKDGRTYPIVVAASTSPARLVEYLHQLRND